jgi:ATP-binding cassette subfamily C protein CydC
MMALLPYLRLFKQHALMMFIGFLLTLVSLVAAMGLLSLSGWFLSAAAVAGLSAATAMAFNFFTPAAGVRFFSILRTASRYGERLATHQATFSLLADLRVWVWKKLLPLSARELQGIRRGDLLNRLVADIDTLDHLYLRLITPMAAALCMIFGLYFFVAWFHVQLALLLSGFLLLVWLVLPWVFYRLGERGGRALPEAKQQCRVQLLDIVQGQSELALFNGNPAYLKRFYQAESELYASQASLAKVAGLSQGTIILCNGIALLSILFLASTLLTSPQMSHQLEPSLSTSSLIAFDGIVSWLGEAKLSGPILALLVFTAMASIEMMQPIALAFHQLSACLASAKRLNALVEQVPSVTFGDKSDANSINNQHTAFAFKGVSFGYQVCDPQYSNITKANLVLSQLDIEVPKGAKVALLGPTGCGKSSLLALLTRAYLPESGSIELNGQPISCFDEASLRASMTVMSQRVDIFSASLRDNLRLAMPIVPKVNQETEPLVPAVQDTHIQAAYIQERLARAEEDKRLVDVLNKVGLSALIEGDDPLGLWLGEGGRPLSGGEQRRIGLARVLLHDSALVLLDEPTEGLDRETENDILKLLFDFTKDKTLFMITHRLTALSRMDIVYRMNAGKVVRL